ncbi:carbohydrate ABC transporter permease [Clostridium sp. DJ247]|uniref:carbohydrate ABC transporter permease n=1 Tax=Clostridium sp. DJ247 TaxID=2726188 RepID=UPI0016283089|nr:sugar ABC transporter permease [Clostridium sp. DJ247]MBC2579461.1 sugar ABC transporter permease [Clostridium sp. DJ247]
MEVDKLYRKKGKAVKLNYAKGKFSNIFFFIGRLKKSQGLTALLFILPASLPLAAFWLWPMFYSTYLSFTDWDFMSPEYKFVGINNYITLFRNKEFYQVLINTVYFTLGNVIPTIIGGLVLALLLNKKLKAMGIFRTILFSPWVTPTVAISIVWSWIFEPRVGLANYILQTFHLHKLQWAQSSKWAMVVILIVTVWKGVGWAMVFYLEALQKVPEELYEASYIDGASSWQKIKNVTIPLISPTTFFLFIITTINSLQAYDQIQIMTQGGPAGSTRTILYMYYQYAFENFNTGEAAAIATILVILTGILSLIQFIASKRWVHYQ